MPKAIEIHGLAKAFGKIKALNDINLEIEEGEIFALLGPNGAGKTTTILILCGLLAPDSGVAKVAGYDTKKDPMKVRQMIGVVFQAPSVDDLLTGRENLYMHALMYGVPENEREERIDRVLSLVGLTERQHSQVREYSGGMRRRLEIARGILHRPKVLFLDEPTVGLDPQTREKIWKYIRKLSQTEKTTVVFTTHYLEEAEMYADRVAIIDKGRILAVGKPRQLVESLEGDIAIFKAKFVKRLVEGLRRFGKVRSATKGQVVAIIKNTTEALPKILRKFNWIESVSLRPATLNDLFIKYTGRQIREEEGEGGYMERIMQNRGK
ncbi:MAG: ATP-binding cassette domain-containing protein [Candidatus Anstonellaceae archaeon]